MPVNLRKIRTMNFPADPKKPWAGILLPTRIVTFKSLKQGRYRAQGGCLGIVAKKQLEPFRSNLAAGGDGSSVVTRGRKPRGW